MKKANKTFNMEQDIIDVVYKYEIKKTALSIIKYIVLISTSIFFAVILFSSVISILQEQKTLDLLDLLHENSEVIRTYFFDTLYVFYTETPKLLSILSILSVIFFIIVIYFLIKNFKRIKNKVISIKKHFKKI